MDLLERDGSKKSTARRIEFHLLDLFIQIVFVAELFRKLNFSIQ